MPAYFSISLQFKRSDIYTTLVKDFYAILNSSGLKFKSGYWGFEDHTLEEIINWNQQKLEQNFELGYDEHYSHNYKQILYTFADYSEVRGFWENKYPEEDKFCYIIILPESEILTDDHPTKFINERVNTLIELTKNLWKFPYIKAIQTGLEGNDASNDIAKIVEGAAPYTLPFSLVEDNGVWHETFSTHELSGCHKGTLYIDLAMIN